MIESTQQERKGRFRMPVSPAMMLDLELKEQDVMKMLRFSVTRMDRVKNTYSGLEINLKSQD